MTIIDDRNGNGRMDAGEPILGSAVSDHVGLYVGPIIVPGKRIIMAVQPAEIGAVWGDPVPLSVPGVALGSAETDHVPYVASAVGRRDRDRLERRGWR